MADLATIARPYAEALYQVARQGDLAAWTQQLDGLALIAGDAGLLQFAASPTSTSAQVFDVVAAAFGQSLSGGVQNFLHTLIENDRLVVLPAIVAQFHALADAAKGVADAVVFSAFPITPADLGPVLAVLEKRFGRKLQATVVVEPELIGGIRVVVGDEVLDTSVKARLERMKVALAA
ncbi:MAG: F0F1 ATP synthase subunit delta [Leptothrix ochracea]|jgi:F-type H+-transporting ATPase subunit delta|uniref:ATP synthase subunit delta n=1 Tax=Leptothrix ochracea L12 TaxID=735332 RepID=I4Z5I2_9BURK|nr:F0F1 ATP synthase subunit delta [Leptothrix ochracea]EIM31474.1 ATP synthase, F1 delta subunit [Leptothrix ochracea L12]